MEDEESLETGALVSQLPDSVKDKVNNLLANGVVAPGIIVGRVLLACHELLWVEQLPIDSSSDLINYGWLQVDKYGPGDMLASSSFREKGVEGIISSSNSFV